MARTLFLMPDTWDLTLDASGNVATATSTYQRAQDIASACRVFTKDMYYNQQEGIPYLPEILGKSVYPLGLYNKALYDSAMSVEGVTSAEIKFNRLKDRILSGSIMFTDIDGNKGAVNL